MHWVCKSCATEYTVDAPRCPHCGSTEHWDSFEYEELMMGKITNHGGLTDQVTGAGFSDDPDDTRPAGTRVGENTGEPAQTDGLPVDDEGHTLTADGEHVLEYEEDGTGEAMAPAEDYPGTERTVDSYDDKAAWAYADLQAEAKSRDSGIATNVSRDDLVAALRADDATRASHEPGA